MRAEENTMNLGEPRVRRPKPLAAGEFQPEISSFRLAWPPKQGREDGADVHRGGPVVRCGTPDPADLLHQMGAGQPGSRSCGWGSITGGR
jgi:hypothetical protein